MPILNKSLVAALVVGAFGALVTQSGFAQSGASYEPRTPQQRVPSPMEGAGGSGGAGGGATGARSPGQGVAFVPKNAPYVTHVRTSTPPPMDPSRLVYEVDCTKPFDALGKGNLRCI